MPRSFRRICVIMTMVIAASATLPAQDTPPSIAQSAPLELTHGKPYVKVMVNGKGPFRFVIDTGTGAQAFVTGELADQLGLPVTGQARLSDPSGQGGQRVPTVLIQSLRVAGVEFTGVRALRHALSGADGSCQGLLGFALFRDYLLTLDYPRRRITLASGALGPDGERSVLPFRTPSGIPIISLHIGDLRIDAQIDSGGTGLSLPERIVSRLKFTSDPALLGNAQSLSTSFQIKAAKLASDVHLGDYTFSRPFVEINSAFPLANFGSSAMQNFSLTFDQKEALIRFDSDRQILHLAATPTRLRMRNEPAERPPDLSLVPVG
jgi:predicted aspartyl protease